MLAPRLLLARTLVRACRCSFHSLVCSMFVLSRVQVESNMARLGVSHPDDEDQSSRIVTSMDLEVAAELLATKTTSFIS